MTRPKQPIPLELPEGDHFVTPAVVASQGLVIPAGKSQAHLMLVLAGGKSLWLPLPDKHVAAQIAAHLEPLLKDES